MDTSRTTLDSPGPPSPGGDDPFAIGKKIGAAFEIRALLGEGGMGAVYEAHDVLLNRRVAVKVARSARYAPALHREAQALAAVRHPAMATVHFIGKHEGFEYFVMERLYGMTLERHLEQREGVHEPLTTREALDLLLAISEGLSAVHRAGISHGDLKPANIMLCPGNRVVLIDFGLFRPDFESPGAMMSGTPGYMAPELAVGMPGRGSGQLADIYALGVVAFEMLAGELPFERETAAELLSAHVNDPAPDLGERRPDLPRGLSELVAELLAKAPGDRPSSVDAICWRVRTLLGRCDEPVSTQYSVLIVDDDPEIAQAIGIFVKQAAPEAAVQFVGSAEGAIQIVRNAVPSLMLLDLDLPGMSGLELCMYLRGTHYADRCHIVSVSGKARNRDVALLHQLGITRFVPKDADLKDRIARVVLELRP